MSFCDAFLELWLYVSHRLLLISGSGLMSGWPVCTWETSKFNNAGEVFGCLKHNLDATCKKTMKKQNLNIKKQFVKISLPLTNSLYLILSINHGNTMESLEDKDTFRRMARSQSNVLRHDFHTCLKNKESKMAWVQLVQNRKREEASEMFLGVELFSNQLMACKHKHTFVHFLVDWHFFKHFQKWLPCCVRISRFRTPPVRQTTRTTIDFCL